MVLFCDVRYFVDISYKGTNYHGWQIQPNGNTIQAEIEHALTTILKMKIPIVGSGRTDAGVHAKQQIAHFDVPHELAPGELTYRLNSFLPKDISIHNIQRVDNDAHARFDALKRTYHYHINPEKDPFRQETSYYFNRELNTGLMEQGCQIIERWKNFECFRKAHTGANNAICEILNAEWRQVNASHVFIVSANRFLRGMVRAMVGTLLEVGTEKITVRTLQEILESNDRKRAGRAVPAHGLFLNQVTY